MNSDTQLEVIYFFGNYYIANRESNEYLKLSIHDKKLMVIDELKYNIILLLSEIKKDLNELK